MVTNDIKISQKMKKIRRLVEHIKIITKWQKTPYYN